MNFVTDVGTNFYSSNLWTGLLDMVGRSLLLSTAHEDPAIPWPSPRVLDRITWMVSLSAAACMFSVWSETKIWSRWHILTGIGAYVFINVADYLTNEELRDDPVDTVAWPGAWAAQSFFGGSLPAPSKEN